MFCKYIAINNTYELYITSNHIKSIPIIYSSWWIQTHLKIVKVDISANTRNHEKPVVGGLLEVGRLRLIVSWTMIILWDAPPPCNSGKWRFIGGYLTTKNGSLRVVTGGRGEHFQIILQKPWKIHYFDGIYQERWGFSWAMLVSETLTKISQILQQPGIEVSWAVWSLSIFSVVFPDHQEPICTWNLALSSIWSSKTRLFPFKQGSFGLQVLYVLEVDKHHSY